MKVFYFVHINKLLKQKLFFLHNQVKNYRIHIFFNLVTGSNKIYLLAVLFQF